MPKMMGKKLKNAVNPFSRRHLFLVILTTILLGAVSHSWGASFSIKQNQMIIDQGGRSIKVEKPFERIISLYGAHTENLFFLGLESRIIGVGRNEKFPPEALYKPVFSYHDDPEKFIAAAPDLVMVRPMIDRGYPQLMKRLEQQGIAVVSLQPAAIEEMFTYWEILGILTGKREASRKMIQQFRNSASDFRRLTADNPRLKKVYFEAIHKRMKTFSPGSMAMFALETAGGINVADDAKPVMQSNIAAYGKERIMAKGDHIDVFLAQKGTMNPVTVEMIKNEPGFKVIKAVKNNQIYLVDEMTVSRPTMRLLTGIFSIGRILYPETFQKKRGNH